MRKRHFLIYYDNRTKEITKTTPRTWAKANKGHFPIYQFTKDSHPTDTVIEKYLTEHYGFTKETYSDYVVTYNYSQSLPEYNGRTFIL